MEQPARTGQDGTVQEGKGLKGSSVGLLGATVIGVSCVAPAYTLTAALGPIVSAVGVQTPAILLIGFLPMLLVAMGYRELNRAVPDNGTSFTWATLAFGPYVGWMAGWGLVVSTVLVLSNSAGIAVDFFYLLLAQSCSALWIAALSADKYINVATCLLFMGVACYVSYRGMHTTKLVQDLLVGLQVLVMCGFGITALTKAHMGQAFDYTPIRLDWFNPLAVSSSGAIAAGLSLSIFIFWGWDVTLTMNEETADATRNPGLAATLTVGITMLLYVLASVAAVNFAGVGVQGIGMGSAAVQRNVFLALAPAVFGPVSLAMALAVLCSSAASLQSTMVSPSRTLLAMSHYGAMPALFSRISKLYHTPHAGIFASTLISSVFYAVMRLVSEHVLWDTITALGIMICFYYSITALSVVWYFRQSWFETPASFLNRLFCPLVGGLVLGGLFFRTLSDSLNPSFGSGSHIGGVGLVFVIGMVIFVTGLGGMIAMRWHRPAFFRHGISVAALAQEAI
jgi:amino acid transporter